MSEQSIHDVIHVLDKVEQGFYETRVDVKKIKEDERRLAELVNALVDRIEFLSNKHGQDLEGETGVKQAREAMQELETDIDASSEYVEEQKRRLDLVLGVAEIGAWELDLQTDQVTWDDNMYALFETAQEEFDGTYEGVLAFIVPRDRKRLVREVTAAVETGNDLLITYQITTGTGRTRHMKAIGRIFPTRNKEGYRMMGVNFDVTAEQEIDKAKSEFVSLASHQLRTPLTTVKWYLEILLSQHDHDFTDDQHECLNQIKLGNDRMIDVVNAFLNVSTIEMGTFVVKGTPVRLRDVVDGVLKEVDFEIKKKDQRLIVDIDKNFPKFPLDVDFAHIVVENVLSNAIKYTPEGGDIQISAHKEGESVILCVKDTGYGIPESQQHRVFSKLFRADNIKQIDSTGTGLGLYIVKSIMDVLEGDVWFTSKEGHGSTFYLKFPFNGTQDDARLNVLKN